jgi:hypothetical protein
MLHAVSFNEVVAVVGLDLKKRIESLLIFLVVSTTNEIELSLGSINTLEIMGELMLIFHFHLLAFLVEEIDVVNHSGILLQQMYHVARWSWVLVCLLTSKHRLGHADWWAIVHVCRCGWHDRFSSELDFWLHRIVWSLVSLVAESFLLMLC